MLEEGGAQLGSERSAFYMSSKGLGEPEHRSTRRSGSQFGHARQRRKRENSNDAVREVETTPSKAVT